jgi:hypothetical protein
MAKEFFNDRISQFFFNLNLFFQAEFVDMVLKNKNILDRFKMVF